MANEKMTEKEYKKMWEDFMFNSSNAHKCAKCPENDPRYYDTEAARTTGNKCGQFTCWVVSACKQMGV